MENFEIISKAPDSEWVILDYGSSDGLLDFIKSTPLATSNQVTVIRLENKFGWHASIAKNAAHKAAQGNILVNLDCDNLISTSLSSINKAFNSHAKLVVHLWSGIHRDGTFGRIAIDRRIFYGLGGYDESFMPAGYEDRDLLNRAIASGNHLSWCPCPPNRAFRNSRKETLSNCTGKHSNVSWHIMERYNRLLSETNIRNGKLTANLPA